MVWVLIDIYQVEKGVGDKKKKALVVHTIFLFMCILALFNIFDYTDN